VTMADARKDRVPPPPEPGGDSAYADAYASGYAEGLREALREMLGHASRGHTVAEFRILIESRIAHILEDVELKRKSLTGPPRRANWGPLLRGGPAGPAATPAVEPGPPFRPSNSYLFREERPEAGLRYLQRLAPQHVAAVFVSANDPPELGLPEEQVAVVHPTAQPGADGIQGRVGPNEVAGAISRATEGPGPVLIYVDTLEFFVTEYGTEQAVRFATWLGNSAREKRATVLLSVDAGALAETDFRRLQRAFTTVV
jgi:hypothetical protein